MDFNVSYSCSLSSAFDNTIYKHLALLSFIDLFPFQFLLLKTDMMKITNTYTNTTHKSSYKNNKAINREDFSAREEEILKEQLVSESS